MTAPQPARRGRPPRLRFPTQPIPSEPVKKTAFARLLNTSPQRVSQLIAARTLTALNGDGWVHPVAALEQLKAAGCFVGAAIAPSLPAFQPLEEAFRQHEIAVARLRRRGLEASKRRWLSRSDAVNVWEAVTGRIRSGLSQIPPQAAARVALCAAPGDIQTALQEVIYAALNAIAETEVVAVGRDDAPSEEPRLLDTSTRLQAETAKVTAQGQIRQLDVAIADGLMVSWAKLERALELPIMAVRSRILALQYVLPPQLLGVSEDLVEGLIRTAVIDALEELPEELPWPEVVPNE